MKFQLVDSDWASIMERSVKHSASSLRVVSPFIKRKAAERLLADGDPSELKVVTRFNLRDFCQRVSDTSALRLLLAHGAQIKGVRGLHAKLYIFGDKRAIVTSANLTESALLSNHEFGCVSDEISIVEKCIAYFTKLWRNGGPLLSSEQIDGWEERIAQVQIAGAGPTSLRGLGDEGTRIGSTPPIVLSEPYDGSVGAFVKFFGTQEKRAKLTLPVLDEIKRSGSHWACAYPKGKRPRKVNSGDVVFISRLMENPIDAKIYGRAIAVAHVPVRDDATPADIQLRDWKTQWPHYVRVHDAQFIAGTLANGISLFKFMDDLGANAFATTHAHASSGEGNIDPRRSVRRQPAVRLSNIGFATMEREFADRIVKYGQVPDAELEALDWPTVPDLDKSDTTPGE